MCVEKKHFGSAVIAGVPVSGVIAWPENQHITEFSAPRCSAVAMDFSCAT